MKKIISILALLPFAVAGCFAQAAGQDAKLDAKPDTKPDAIEITVEDYTANSQGAVFNVVVDVDPSALDLHTQTLLTLTPVLRSKDGQQEHRFVPVAFAGPVRYRVIRREMRYGDFEFETQPGVFAMHRVKDAKPISMQLEIPFEKWMRQSELLFVETRRGCDGCDLSDEGGGTRTVLTPIFPEPYKPTFAVDFVTPEVEAVKSRSDSFTANLAFQSGKSVLLRNFGDNARQLDEVDRVLSEIKSDPLLSISDISVTGYASPEGNQTSNQRLSEDRAQAFVKYLRTNHIGQRGVEIRSQGMGEDWDGLRRAVVAASWLQGQQAVLDAIDNMENIVRRKNSIRAISGGRTYRTMLTELYPPLRRNEYTVGYTVRSFNVEEAVEVYKNRPQLLSLNELFMVASTYDSNSEEFKQVFDFAARMYPDSPVAQFNTAALEVETGAYQNAIRRMEGVETPQAWNNLGVAYWHLGEYPMAEEWLKKAADAGSEVATRNLEEFRKWEEDR